MEFDDLSITQTKNNVVQYNEYYPFGLQAQRSWTRENSKNNFLGNGGSEMNSTSGWYDTFYRGYDPALGRFHQVDPKATMTADFTPYHYSANNPVMFNDPGGDHYVQHDDTWDGKQSTPTGSGGDGFDPGMIFGAMAAADSWYQDTRPGYQGGPNGMGSMQLAVANGDISPYEYGQYLGSVARKEAQAALSGYVVMTVEAKDGNKYNVFVNFENDEVTSVAAVNLKSEASLAIWRNSQDWTSSIEGSAGQEGLDGYHDFALSGRLSVGPQGTMETGDFVLAPYATGITNALSVDLGSRTIYSKSATIGKRGSNVETVKWGDKNYTQSLEFTTILGYSFSAQRSIYPFGKAETWSTSTTFQGLGVEVNNNGISIGYMGSAKIAAGFGAEFSARNVYSIDLW